MNISFKFNACKCLKLEPKRNIIELFLTIIIYDSFICKSENPVISDFCGSTYYVLNKSIIYKVFIALSLKLVLITFFSSSFVTY
jgi:hypothetical protein